MRRSTTATLMVVVMVLSGSLAALAFGTYGNWSQAVDIESFGPGAHGDFNTAALEGCPFVAPDGLVFFFASNRSGGLGGLDIYVSTREHKSDPWGQPVNVGAPINSTANDFCPTIGRDGRTFFFVSTRPGHCGATPNADIYQARLGENLQAVSVAHLGCVVNSPFDEASPFPINMPGLGPVLFYSSNRPGGVGGMDIYMSRSLGGVYGTGELVPGVNTTSNDGWPNLRRDGLELFFASNRPGGEGNNDIYSASRASAHDPWSPPVNLGQNVNSSANELRPSLSWDGTTLYFGSTRVGGQFDIYATSR